MYTPINEGIDEYMGFPYGLGTTEQHIANAPKLAKSKKTGIVMTGASTPRQIGDRLAVRAQELTNSKIAFANLCIPAKDLNDWLTEAVWTTAMNTLSAAGLTANQVQVLLIQNDDLANPEVSFPERPQELAEKFKDVIDKHLEKFPNVKQIYLLSRTTTLWASDPTHAEPKGYHNGWACKFVTEDSKNGVYAPWVCDSFYMFTDGETPNSNGLAILRTDFKGEGVHYTNSGKTKVGDWLHAQLLAHPVTKAYYF